MGSKNRQKNAKILISLLTFVTIFASLPARAEQYSETTSDAKTEMLDAKDELYSIKSETTTTENSAFIDALTKAYISNPTLTAIRAELRAVDEQVPQALANWRPQVLLQAQGSRVHTTIKTFAGGRVAGGGEVDDGDTTLDLQANVQQSLYRGGRTVAETERAESNVLFNRERLRATEQNVLLQAVTSYSDVFRDTNILSLQRENEDILERQLVAAQDRFDVGEITRTDVAQAESRLARANADRQQAEAQLGQSKAVYFQIIGEEPGIIERPFIIGELPLSEAEAIQKAVYTNPNVIGASHNANVAQKDVDIATGFLLPELTLNGQYRFNVASFDSTDRAIANTDHVQTFSATLNLAVPLYQQGLRYSQIRGAKHVYGQRRQQVEEQRRLAQQQTESAWEDFVANKQNTIYFTKQVDAARIAFEGAEQEALVGSRTVLDVLDTQQEMIDAKINLKNVERNEIVAAYQLKQGIGELTARKLELPVTYYDETLNYRNNRDRWFGTSIDPFK